MSKVKYLVGVSLLLMDLGANAHMTIAGFERTLSLRQRRYLELFIQNAKQDLYTKCYYTPIYKTVACQNQAGDRRLFQFK